MADRIVCRCKNVSYVDIRKAMIQGARTVEDIQKMTGAGTGCGGCISEIEKILSIACSCNQVPMETVLESINNGADTVEKVGESTKAGTTCGRCKALIQNMIDNKR